jgi:hypothetical protein
MCYKEGDIRVEDIKPEDLSGGAITSYLTISSTQYTHCATAEIGMGVI